MTFKLTKALLCCYAETLHRYCFDKIYIHGKTISLKEKLIIKWYNVLFYIAPDFRTYLKKYKPILIRAYKLKKLSPMRVYAFFGVLNRNVIRYN